MTQLHDIRHIFFSFEIRTEIFFIFGVLLFIFLYYLIIKKYFFTDFEEPKKENNIEDIRVSLEKFYREKIGELEKNSDTFSKGEFYGKIQYILRKKFSEKHGKKIFSLSYEELKKQKNIFQNKSEEKYFSEIYFLEFQEAEDKNFRKKYIEKLKKIIF